MNRILKLALAAAFAAGGASMALAQAPTAGPGQGPMMHRDMRAHDMHGLRGGEGRTAMRPTERAEARLAYLKTALKITPAQEPQWNAFAEFVRRTAGEMQARWEARHNEGPRGANAPAERPNAIERLEREQAFVSAQAKRLSELLAVQKPLYEVLSPEQRKIADEVLDPRMRSMRAGFRRG